MTTFAEMEAAYAESVGKDVLTDAEKRQAFLNAVLDGQRIEPFATLNDIQNAYRDIYRPAERAIEDWIREMQQ